MEHVPRAARGSLHFLYALLALLLGGCNFPPKPNPNDPNQVSGERQPYVIRDYMQRLCDVVNAAVATKQISDARGVEITAQEAKAFMDGIKFKSTPANEQAIVAQGFITAQEWSKAKSRLEIAFTSNQSPDGLVGNRLKYARCLANLGDVDAAIKWARAAFEAPPEFKWPILYSVYLEIVPAAVRLKPSARLALAKLVEDAITQHQAATSNSDSPGAANLVLARPHHIEMAWRLVMKLYADANRPDLAKAATERRNASGSPHTVQV